MTVFKEPFGLLKNRLNNFYKENCATTRIVGIRETKRDPIEVGESFASFCQAPISSWCRVQVIGIGTETDKVTVMLVDYAEK